MSNECFGYDGLRELTEAWTTTADACQPSPTQAVVGGPESYWSSFTYNTTGGRTQEIRHSAGGDTTRKYVYPKAKAVQPHALASVTTSTGSVVAPSADAYVYDPAGNLTTRSLAGKASQQLTWDPEGHLASVGDDAGTTTYLYDADGNRLLSRDGEGTTAYLGSQELRLPRGTATVTATRFYGSGAVRTTLGGLVWQSADHHGTTQLSINAGDLSTTRRRFDPFGNPRGSQPAWPTTRGFVNGVSDPTGLTHLGAREYDPSIGRFVSVDPILDAGDPLQMNGYSYANGRPVTSSDPSGLIIPGSTQKRIPPESWGNDSPDNGEWNDFLDTPAPRPGYEKKPKTFQNLLKAHGYKGSDKFTNKDALELAASSTDAWSWVCSVIYGGGMETCQSNPFSNKSAKYNLMVIGAVMGSFVAGYACAAAPLTCINGIVDGAGAFYGYGNPIGALERPVMPEGLELAMGRLGRCLNSFDPDTPVLMGDGSTKPIKDVEVGDEVVAADPETGESVRRQVTKLHNNEDTDLTDLTVETSDGQAPVIHTTRYHRFWNDATKRWVAAGDLAPGTPLRTTDQQAVRVLAVDNHPGNQTMLNLTVGDPHVYRFHTYYVVAGTTPVLVHNTGCWSTSTTKAGDLAGKYKPGQSTRDPASQWYHETLSNEELLNSINNAAEGDGIVVSRNGAILGGHHRWDELQTRIKDKLIDPNTKIRIQVYGGE